MNSLYFRFPGNLVFNLISKKPFIFEEKEQLLLKAYVPGAEIVDISPRSVDLVIELKNSKQKKILQTQEKILIFDNWVNEIPLDFYHLLYSLVRKEWLKKNLFSVHAACLGKNKYILLVGHSGAGKTTIALELLKKGKTSIFSGNKTLISFDRQANIKVIAGTKTVTTIFSTAKINYPIPKNSKYQDRIAFTPKEFTQQIKPIKAIVLVGLNDGVKEKNKLSHNSALHKLYPFFLDVVNADTILCDGKEIFTGLPPKGGQRFLARSLETALKKIPVYSLKGSLPFVVENLKKI